ncbi:MAG: imidazoleglycerol-phosphate dehydratase HisB [Clostridia bacterium]|nr:imidazoleglycerol-phosphate dehydratase HisB [Clostridia bacterium]
MRTATINRKTAETDISLSLTLEGTGKHNIDTGCGFLDHMLTLFAVHGRFNLDVKCIGDTHVDDHHTVEDVGICIGEAFTKALADKKGITRYGFMAVAMDEALLLCALDISGRASLNYGLRVPTQKVGTFDTELTLEFFEAFVRACPMSLHLKQEAGKNSHHIIEGAFKAFGRAMKIAVKIDEQTKNEIPSSKGVL